MLESIKELRDYISEHFDKGSYEYFKMMSRASDIEHEISKNYIERERVIEAPLDADGVVWKYDDELFVDESGDRHKLKAMRIDENGKWMLHSPSGWYLASECCHVEPRTIESVLQERIDDVLRVMAVGEVVSLEAILNDSFGKECADELRDMFGGDAS